MVDTIEERLYRSLISNNDNHRGCLPNRLGSASTQHSPKAEVQQAHKLAGAKGTPQRMQPLSTSKQKQSHQDPHGQCSMHVLHKPPTGGGVA